MVKQVDALIWNFNYVLFIVILLHRRSCVDLSSRQSYSLTAVHSDILTSRNEALVSALVPDSTTQLFSLLSATIGR